jgi:hypothetical protein
MTAHGRHLPLTSASDPAGDTAPADDMPGGTSGGMTRRSALQGLAAGLGLAVGTPAEAHEAHHPLAAHIAQRPAKPAATGATKTPQFLDAHQFSTLTIVSELIVPGSVASGSPAYIDEVLAIEHEDVRRRFVSALGAVDAAAREAHGTTFRALTPARQLALLEASAAPAPAPPPPAPPPPDAPAPSPSSSAPQVSALARPLTVLKTWIAGAHYSSEAGMKELGFTGNVFFQSFPACTHADGHE